MSLDASKFHEEGGSPDEAAYRIPQLVSVYDALNADRRDFGFHLAAVGKAPIRILDIGCGTGSLAVAFAELGHAVHAVDPSNAMIDAALRKPGAERVSWFVGQCDAVPDDAVFDRVVMTGHAFQCLITDAEISDLFRDVRPHLAPEGRFVFDTRDPDARAWEGWKPHLAAQPVRLSTGDSVQLVHNVIAHADEVVTYEETFKFSSGGQEFVSVNRLRFADRQTISRLACAENLVVDSVYGDWDRRTQGPELIFELTAGHADGR